MASLQEERRVMIIHDPERNLQKRDLEANGELKSEHLANNPSIFHLKHPKNGSSVCYFLLGESLQEMHWVKPRFASWFIGNRVCEDGSLYICTPVDILFVLLPLLEKSRMKKGDGEGIFRTLEDILHVEGYPAFRLLHSIAERHLSLICQVKELSSDKFYRLDDKRVMAWLKVKVKHTCAALRSHAGSSLKFLNDNDLRAYAVGMLGEYLDGQTWHQKLREQLGTDKFSTQKEMEAHLREQSLLANSVPPEYTSTSKEKKSKPSSTKSPSVGNLKITRFFQKPR